jgi:cell division protein FtsX
MEDPEQYSQVAAVLKGQPGIDQIVDQSAFLDRLFAGDQGVPGRRAARRRS